MENRKRYKFGYFLFLIAVVCFVVGFRSFLLAYIIEPIAVLCWAVWRILLSVDQNIYWALLIVICSVFITYHLLPGKEPAPRSLYRERENAINRVEYWQMLIRDAASGGQKAEQLRENLKQLLGRLIAQKEHLEFIDVDKMLAEKQGSLPPAVREFLPSLEDEHATFQQKMMCLTPEWFRRWTGKWRRKDISLVDEILCWMENELEINNGK